VETLWAIAAALRVPFARLVEEERTALRVVRARRPHHPGVVEHLTWSWAA